MKKDNFHNSGQTRDEKIQNYFTACLRTALRRERVRYLFRRDRERKHLHDLPEDEWMDSDQDVSHWLASQENTQDLPRSWDEFLQEVEAEWLYKILCTLSRDEADILYWHIILDLRYAEIQKLTGIPADKAQIRYSSAIRKIRNALLREKKVK